MIFGNKIVLAILNASDAGNLGTALLVCQCVLLKNQLIEQNL